MSIVKVDSDKRDSWEKYFMKLAVIASSRATCDRAHVGCVLVNDNRQIISTGYNGSLPKNPHCDEVGHKMRDNHCVRTIHAEMNAILSCSREGIKAEGVKCYVTHFPCLLCTKLLLGIGISEIYYLNEYTPDDFTLELLKANGVKFERIVLE